ncbi:valine--tRNA ligase [Neorickettsia sp. 179522]|uniref:valine--tRNA ligase n=1 Tax=Neorickettsia sp. 179522 TaxID=1714371 RepID=UPI0007914172|nr:valine--tRNA ligase [Neorickettsia sp. 179522]KYH12918.1 valine--tRNA ligase [Neorickettsia sp. 179522]
MAKLANRYNFSQIECDCKTRWKEKQIYKFSPQCKDIFSIDTPPPTISGSLHIGHVFSYCHTDFIARYQRMRGKNVFYSLGFDNNGLPTERLVEKSCKVKAYKSDRTEFIGLCETISVEKIKEFKELFDSIGLSIDWDFSYQTNSEDCKRLSQESFLYLYGKGLLYRKKMPILWDVIDQTAIAQAEVEEKEFDSKMNYILFLCEENGDVNIESDIHSKCEVAIKTSEKTSGNVSAVVGNPDDNALEVNEACKGDFTRANSHEQRCSSMLSSCTNSRKLEVGTTRPELLPACVALLYNPSDERYKNLEGKYAITPIFNKRVPIIPDPDVIVEKGTGLVMCCTFGDEMDIKWWQKYDLPLVEVIDRYGRIDLLDGKKVEDAREYVLEKLMEEGLLTRQEDITHRVKCAERSGGKLEIISTYQWYIEILKHKEELKNKVQEIDWLPEKMRIKIEQWIEGLKWDWCISRQRYLGVRVPVYYEKETGSILLPEFSELPVESDVIFRDGKTYIQDKDVLDTWATSSLSPQINYSLLMKSMRNSRGVNQMNTVPVTEVCSTLLDEKRPQFHPMSLRPQAHEIIRTWAFYTILRSFLEYRTVPWRRVMVSGWCLASDKSKMSKSKGNALDPVKLIAEHGADVVRYWSASAGLGCDTCFSENVFLIGKKLVNKIWSAARFIEQFLVSDPELFKVSYVTDLWILSRLSEVVKGVELALESCDYFHAKALIERFFLHEYCDNYLELVKSRAYNDVLGRESVLHALSISLAVILKLFAPFLPYVTDAIYSTLFPGAVSLHSGFTWPDEISLGRKITFAGSDFIKILAKVREFKSEHSISMKKEVSLVEIKTAAVEMMEAEYDIKAATNSARIAWIIDDVPNGLEVKIFL